MHFQYGGKFDNGTVCLAVVDTRALCESTDNPPCLVPIETAVILVLDLEDPLAIDNVRAGRTRNKCPRLVGEKGVILRLHGGAPIGIAERGGH